MKKSSYKILIVDDDKAFLGMVIAVLKSTRDLVAIETARSGKECLQKVKSFSPNVVFLDIGMDGMNGLVTLRFIKSMDAAARVFFLSGHSLKDIKEAVGMVQVEGYFTKTHFLDLLKEKVSLEEVLKEGKIKQ